MSDTVPGGWTPATKLTYRIGMWIDVLPDSLEATLPYRAQVLDVNRINQPYVRRETGRKVPFFLFGEWVREVHLL